MNASISSNPLTDEELEEWGISREKLNACFAEGIELMERNTKPD